MQTSSNLLSAADEIIASRSGITDSPPSSENRFWPTYLVCKNDSKASAEFNFLKIRSCSSRAVLGAPTSIRS